MSDSQNDKGVGEQVKDAVQRALDSGDFRDVNRIVANTVNGALSEAGRQIKRAAEEAGRGNGFGQAPPQKQAGGSYTPGQGNTAAGRQAASGRNTAGNGAYNKSRNVSQNPGYYRNTAYMQNQKPAVKVQRVAPAPWAVYASTGRLKKVGQTTGTLMIVFGSIGTGISALILLVTLLGLLSEPFTSLGALFGSISGMAAVLLAFIVMIEFGCVKIERIKRAKRYANLFGGKAYCNVEDLALQMNRSKRFVLRDIKRMLRMGIFPQGHLDEQESCLMLDDNTYREYIRVQRERKLQDAEEKAVQKLSDKKNPEPVEVKPQENSGLGRVEQEALNGLMAQGQDCIRRLRDMNDAIEGEVISLKLFRLENILKEIFGRVQEHPEQVPQMRKFMDYYLPTTLKLVQAYAEFDDVSAPGEHILSAKTEIEGTLDTINQAFEELLNKLFMDAAMDVTTDAQVLQTMLAQEGLTREPEFARRSGQE